jgi:L-serine/L-threonine ammonia-lyase
MLSYLRSHASTNPNPHFYSSSGGNAGLACAVAASTLGYPVTVVVPLTTKPLMIAKIRAGGADDVLQHGASWKEADTYLRNEVLGRDKSGVYVPPFDALDIWEGNSTVVDEIADQLYNDIKSPLSVVSSEEVKPSAIICSVGGGGLFCGIMRGLDRQSWQSTPVIAVETEGADSLAASIRARELVTLPAITSQATSLGATRVAAQAFKYAMTLPKQVRSVVVQDLDAARACCWCADEERMVIELACGASLAVCREGNIVEGALGRTLCKDDVIVIVLCGGSNVTVEMLEGWRREHHVKAVMAPN